jgi:hypothetical protein
LQTIPKVWRDVTGFQEVEFETEFIMQRPWATSPIGDPPRTTLSALQAGLTVDLIATSRDLFETCSTDEAVQSVIDRSRTKSFDFLPVLDSSSSRIVGLFEISRFTTCAKPDIPVAAAMQHLSEENMLGADASILAFVRNADQRRCRLIISQNEISGLVSLSDLQRLPVRAALFGLVTYLEIVMANVIRRKFESDEAWLNVLPTGRRDNLKNEIAKAVSSGNLVDPLLFTQFADKATLIRGYVKSSIGRDAFERDFKTMQSLRDHLAHANDYAASPDAAAETCRSARLIERWTDKLLELFDVR